MRRAETADDDEAFGRPRTRREALALLGGLGAAVVVAGCSGGSSSKDAASTSTTRASVSSGGSGASATTTSPSASTTSCAPIPEETAGPFPADGSNGPNALALDGIVRSDIRSSISGASGVADGVPLEVTLTVVDTSNGCAPMSGAAVYLWHCDAAGGYSMYGSGITGENYLRGVQPVASDGTATFTSIFPAAYSGRWPHIHFQVYPSVSQATAAKGRLRTSQLALPESVCDSVYETSGYGGSLSNLERTSLSTDMVFRDGYSLQLATLTGNTDDGYTAALLVGV
ncbi:MAG TPA: intradiol ring-cleavage dioxygenase [Acidimicrobiia bacterium]